MTEEARTVEDFFAHSPVGLATYERLRTELDTTHPDVTVRVSKSQVAFRRRRGFAYLWCPGQYLRGTHPPVVLSLALTQELASPRFKEVVHPGPWMHHLEIVSPRDVDDEVLGWVRLAADEAGPRTDGVRRSP